MSGINSGILHNAYPLSATQVKEVEKDVILNNKCIAYLDENNHICFAQPHDPEGIKRLAWNNAYQLLEQDSSFIKKVYSKTGLDTFILDKVLEKNNIDDSWSEIEVPHEPQDAELILSATSGSLTVSETGSFTILTHMSDGELSVSSSDDSVATVALNGSTVNITPVSTGTVVITVMSAATENYNSATARYILAIKTNLAPGLYQTGTSTLVKSWQQLLNNGTLHVSNGVLTSNYTETRDDCENSSANTLVGDLVIADSVTSLGPHALEMCVGLTDVYIPDSVTYIGSGALACTSISKINIPDGAVFDGLAFGSCENLRTVVIPDSQTALENSSFSYCSNLTSFYIPSSITAIKDNVFYSCTNLTSVTFEENSQLTSIGNGSFERCSKLASIHIPDGVTSINSRAFRYCSNLESVEIPESVTTIGDSAFYNCTKLNSITYSGTIEQWSTITKKSSWNYKVPATHIQCSDGQVAL